MDGQYVILAKSALGYPDLREIQLAQVGLLTDPILAQRLADSFADRCNERKAGGTNDWKGAIEWQNVTSQ